jgi:hypothetical protein
MSFDGKKLIAEFQTPLPESMLLEYDFFDLYPNDGGGGFVMRQELPASSDRAITDLILYHDGLGNYGTLPKIDYHKFDSWSTIERASWINRVYFIPSLARIARLDRNSDLAKLIVATLLELHRNSAPPETAAAAQFLDVETIRRRNEEYNRGKGGNKSISYQWYDFQPPSRLIYIIQALGFLRQMDCLTDVEADELAQMVFTHAQVIYWQEMTAPYRWGNHQALRALAMIYGGCFCHDRDFLTLGIKRMNEHILADFAQDGLLLEASPTYHCLETWIARDACYLAEKYGFELDKQAVERFEKAASTTRLLCRPDNRLTVLNDGCNLNCLPFIATLPAVKTEAVKEHDWLENNRIAIWRTEKWYLLMDMSHFTGQFSHYHAGKNALNIWYQDAPFIVDSGCCDYDAPEFKAYFKNGEAHASLLVDGMGDGKVQGAYDWLHFASLTSTPWQDNCISGRLTSTVPSWSGVVWERTLNTKNDHLEITDIITADKAHQYEFIYPLHPDVRAIFAENQIRLVNGSAELLMAFDSNHLLTIGLRPALWCDGTDILPTRAIRVMLNDDNIKLKCSITHL